MSKYAELDAAVFRLTIGILMTWLVVEMVAKHLPS